MIQIFQSNSQLKKGYSTIQSLCSWNEYKSLSHQLSLHLLDLCRPKAPNKLGLEIMVNIYLYFMASTKPFAKSNTCYGLKFLINPEIKFGGSAAKISAQLHELFITLILDDTKNLQEWELWRNGTPSNIMSIPVINFPHYRNWKSQPIILDKVVDYLLRDRRGDRFEWSPNSSWGYKARTVLETYFMFRENREDNAHFYYSIRYGCGVRDSSCWEVIIKCNPNETFVDFVHRLSKHDLLTKEGRTHLKKTEHWEYYHLI